MTSLVHDVVHVDTSPDAIRAVLHDPDALRRVLPGCESLESTGPDAYQAVLAVRVGFMTIRAEVAATIDDSGPGEPLRLAMTGRPRGLVGSFTVDVPFELEPDDDGTRITYEVDLTVSGRLAAFGGLIMRDAARRQIAELVKNLERESHA